MSDYIVTGKKGNGKSLVCVGKIRDAVLQGRRIATNLDLYVENLVPLTVKHVDIVRLPDYPTMEEMEALGMGSQKLDEEMYGLIVLDEMAQWMNAREYGDKTRMPLLKWFTESRKKRWECYFICQGLEQLDKQFRTTLADHHVSCRRLDKLRIPFVGVITKNFLGKEIRPPKMHHASVRFGMEHNALKVDSWTYRGVSLYKAYNTEQTFDTDYEHGSYCLLSGWHTKARHENKAYNLRQWLYMLFNPPKPKRHSWKPKNAAVAHIAANRRLTKDQAWKATKLILENASLQASSLTSKQQIAT